MSIVIWILTFFLILTSLFLVLIVLAQKAKSDGGMGAAMGGGMAEAAFGAETSNVLSKSTIYAAIAFFVLSLVLYLSRLHQAKHGVGGGSLPEISAPATLPTTAVPPAGETPAVALPAVPAATTGTAPAATTPAPVTEPAKQP